MASVAISSVAGLIADGMSVRQTIIVHTHKCAGTSLRRSLIEALGADAVYEDYGDDPQNPAALYHTDPRSFWARQSFAPVRDVVFGHFHIRKYDHMVGAARVALLRHPLDRLISHYLFWRHCRPKPLNILWRQVYEERRDIEWFAAVPLVNGLFRHVYFGGVDMRKFDLLILYDQLENGTAALSRLLGVRLGLPRVNTTKERWAEYDVAKASIMKDTGLMNRLGRCLTEEIDFYERCLRLPNASSDAGSGG